MNIALLADARKNELLQNFCLAYSHILRKHKLISFFSSARQLTSIRNIQVQPLIGNNAAGTGQLAAQAMYNELDAVIYLRDPQELDTEETLALQRACDYNSIPYASNLASAEILLLAIDQGDLDYREYLQDRRRG